ncbi:hypothetical protein [Mycobacterium sp.]|uniref:hypothetical protein n=1 Tax=Mycobacterium sp. TaxID=1785 RepID=UPI003F9C4F81
MPAKRNDREQLPWPTRHVCNDGTMRNLAQFIPEEWPDERSAKMSWHAVRSGIGKSLGRKALPEISAMTGHGPLAHYTGGPEPLAW